MHALIRVGFLAYVKYTFDRQHLNSNLPEIGYVSCLLRNKLDTSAENDDTNDNYAERNLWAYVKYMFDRKDLVLSTFTVTEFISYLKNGLAKVNPNKLFAIPKRCHYLMTYLTEANSSCVVIKEVFPKNGRRLARHDSIKKGNSEYVSNFRPLISQ